MNRFKPLVTSIGLLGWLCTLLWYLLGPGLETKIQAQAERAAGTSDDEFVYLDPSGFIRVLDPDVIPRAREVQWVSPEGGWRALALGDFNADGDYEIAAVGGEGKDAKLAIYDPVIANISDIDVNKTANEIPWNTLFYTSTINSTLARGKPLQIAAGELNPAVPGDELIFNLEIIDDAQSTFSHRGSELMIWQRQPTTTTIQSWQPKLSPVHFDQVWSTIILGEVDNQGAMEIGLLDPGDGVMRAYRLDGNRLTQLYNYESNDRPWFDAAIGQTYTGDFGELVAVRETPRGLPNMIVFRYVTTSDNDLYFKDRLTDFFDPSPTHVFLANVDGFVQVMDGGVPKDVDDDEIFMLRSLPANAGQTAPHLIMRNPGEDKKNVARFEIRLDTDNGYQAGLGAEVDGDGKDEVVIMRNNNIRLFLDPEINANSVRNYTVNSDSKTLRAANLDALGYPRLPKIVIKPSSLAQNLPAGDKTQTVISITNEGNIENVPFNVYLGGNSTWLRAEPATGQTPAQINIFYDAYGLPPVSDFLAILDIVPNHPQVPGQTVQIPVSLHTTPGLWPNPDRVVGLIDCTTRAIKSYQIRIAGLQGVPYTANLNDFISVQSAATEPLSLAPTEPYTVAWPSTVAWATVTGLGTILPTTLTLTFNPSPERFAGSLLQAQLDIQATNNQGGSSGITIPVAITCQNESYYLPWVDR